MSSNDVITHQIDEQKTISSNDLTTSSVDVNGQNCHTQTTTKTATNPTLDNFSENSTGKNHQNKGDKEKSSHLLDKHIQECCIKRGLDRHWIEANCSSLTATEATQKLHYTAKSEGILIEGANGQYQYKPNSPWSNKQGKKAAKYRTAAGDEYDALLPAHPSDRYYWTDIEALKQRCHQINGHPMLLITEGGFKAIALCSHELPTIALLGVEMGLTSSKDDPQGKRYLVQTLEKFAKLGFGFIFAFDADTYTKKPVKEALIKLARALQKYGVPVYTLPSWSENEGKGVDDYIQQNGIEEFRKHLLDYCIDYDSWQERYGNDAFDKKPPKPDIIGGEIAEKYGERWVYCDELKTWLTYNLDTEGIWTIVSEQYLAAEIDAILAARNITGYGTNAYIQNIIGKLKRNLFIRTWDESSSAEWLPFRNGVLELATNKLHEHSPEFRFTWQLPRDYTVVETGWQKIDDWLNEATRFNAEQKQILVCFAAAVLRGRNDLQKFLHLIGGGGSGKSTFTNLLTALIGESNTATLNLSDLEDKHEVARIFGKRLLVLPDQDKAPPKMCNFKRLTGQDRLSGRRLFENGFEFVFSGLTVVTSNAPIFHSNIGSWLTRRVSMIPFEYQCPNHQKRDLIKEFERELGAFTSYLLSISNEEIDQTFKGAKTKTLSSTVWESQIRSDGLAAWVNDWVIRDDSAKVAIGSNGKEWMDDNYNAVTSTLYGSYALYCRQSSRSAKSPQNFSAELLELVNRILGWNANKTRTTMGGKTVRVIQGLRLRKSFDLELTTEEQLIDHDIQQDKINDNLCDPGKSPPGNNSDNYDNLKLKSEEIESNFSLDCDSYRIGTVKEQGNNHLISQPPSVVIPVTTGSEQEIEIVPSAGDNIPPVVTSKVTTPVTQEINWQTYPYNSSDIYTLQNRADKVKERILNCSTNNELQKLLYTSGATEVELNWLVENYLTATEVKQLQQIQSLTQGNLFIEPQPQPEIIEYDFNDIKTDIDAQMQRIGWTVEQGKQYLIDKYNKKSRLHLSDEELLEFWEYLKFAKKN